MLKIIKLKVQTINIYVPSSSIIGFGYVGYEIFHWYGKLRS